MNFDDLNVGYAPRRHPGQAIWLGLAGFAATVAVQLLAQTFLAPTPDGEQEIYRVDLSVALHAIGHGLHDKLRLAAVLVTGFAAGVVALHHMWRRTSLTEPFLQLDDNGPQLLYSENARDDFQRRLFDEAGWGAPTGLYLAPYLPLPYAAELKNILVMGAPNSGKTNIVRALVDQSIARNDRILLLCNKGDVTQSFSADEAILIAPLHAEGYDLDLAADISDAASAQQFTVDVIPESKPPFWSDSARSVLTDVVLNEIATRGREWNARTLLEAALQDTEVIRRAILKIDLSAARLIEGAEDDDRTAAGILTTMRSGVFANLRGLAWASSAIAKERRFSVKRWLSPNYKGPRTLIAQYSPENAQLSTLVIGGLIKRITRRLADPSVPIDPHRRVVLCLDEFNALGKVEDIDSALAVGREKGLCVILGVQNVDLIIKKYGSDMANAIFGMFQIKIIGRLEAGEGAKAVSGWMGKRHVSALIPNRTPKSDDKRKHVEETRDIETYSASRIAKRLGIHSDGARRFVRAIVQAYGQVYELEWPLTLWRKKREGYVPAQWVNKIPLVPRPAPPSQSR